MARRCSCYLEAAASPGSQECGHEGPPRAGPTAPLICTAGPRGLAAGTSSASVSGVTRGREAGPALQVLTPWPTLSLRCCYRTSPPRSRLGHLGSHDPQVPLGAAMRSIPGLLRPCGTHEQAGTTL